MLKDFAGASQGVKNPHEFVTSIDVNGNKFVFNFLKQLPWADKSSTDMVELLVKSINLPDISFEGLEAFKGGVTKTLAGKMTVAPAELTLFNDKNSLQQAFWNSWVQFIRNGSTGNLRAFPDTYRVDIEIIKLSESQFEPVVKYVLKNAYPLSVGGLNLDRTEDSTPKEFTVSMSVELVEVSLLGIEVFTREADPSVVGRQGPTIGNSVFDFESKTESVSDELNRRASNVRKSASIEFENIVRNSLPDILENASLTDMRKNISILFQHLEGKARDAISGNLRTSGVSGRPVSIIWDEDITKDSGDKINYDYLFKWPTNVIK